MGVKTCAVTGHRQIDDSKSKIEYVKQILQAEILLAIKDGYTNFISGFAEGADMLFADIIIKLKDIYPITLEAAVPYRNRMRTKNSEFQNLILKCDRVNIISEDYLPSCFMKRNRFLVDNSNRIIAIYDGREKGGTFSTVKYAYRFNREVKVISV